MLTTVLFFLKLTIGILSVIAALLSIFLLFQ